MSWTEDITPICVSELISLVDWRRGNLKFSGNGQYCLHPACYLIPNHRGPHAKLVAIGESLFELFLENLSVIVKVEELRESRYGQVSTVGHKFTVIQDKD